MYRDPRIHGVRCLLERDIDNNCNMQICRGCRLDSSVVSFNSNSNYSCSVGYCCRLQTQIGSIRFACYNFRPRLPRSSENCGFKTRAAAPIASSLRFYYSCKLKQVIVSVIARALVGSSSNDHRIGNVVFGCHDFKLLFQVDRFRFDRQQRSRGSARRSEVQYGDLGHSRAKNTQR